MRCRCKNITNMHFILQICKKCSTFAAVFEINYNKIWQHKKKPLRNWLLTARNTDLYFLRVRFMMVWAQCMITVRTALS